MLNRDYKDMLLCLQKHGVDFIIVGAYALAAHGLPRATGDIDILVRPSTINGEKVIHALVEFGAPLQGLSASEFATLGNVVQIGVEPCRIDLLTEVDGVDFDQLWSNKMTITVDDIRVDIISKKDLITNKKAAGRPKDLLDLDWLLSGR